MGTGTFSPPVGGAACQCHKAIYDGPFDKQLKEDLATLHEQTTKWQPHFAVSKEKVMSDHTLVCQGKKQKQNPE